MTHIGVNTAATISSITGGNAHGLGDRYLDESGNEWVFCYASGVSITQYDLVRINKDFHIAQGTIDNLKVANEVGFAQIAFGVDTYGWVMQRGRPTVRLASACDVDLPLYATTTGGVVDDATTSCMIQGLVATVSVTSATTAGACVANYPQAIWGQNLTGSVT